VGGWYCVQIDHPRLVRTIDLTFRNVLVGEYRDLGQPENWRVFRKSFDDGSHCYFFSPEAARQLAALVNWWQGIEVPEPQDLDEMSRII